VNKPPPLASTATRDRILEVAPAVLRRFTLSKFSMEDVAKAAGLARQTIYKHFSSKDDLLIAMFIEEMKVNHAPTLTPLVRAKPTADALLDLLMAELRLARGYALFADVLDPAVAPRMAELVFGSEKMAAVRQEIWFPVLRRYAEAGVLRPDLDHADAIRWMTYQEFWFLTHPTALTEDEDELTRYVRQFIIAAMISPAAAESSRRKAGKTALASRAKQSA
jgi:AcrR family transcriptional regulator